MITSLEFTQAQLCELWTQHTALEDDPRDANSDLRLAFEDDDALRQQLTVAPDVADDDTRSPMAIAALRGRFERVRQTRESVWSVWSRVD